jgi:hypothetical protein
MQDSKKMGKWENGKMGKWGKCESKKVPSHDYSRDGTFYNG